MVSNLWRIATDVSGNYQAIQSLNFKPYQIDFRGSRILGILLEHNLSMENVSVDMVPD